MELYKKIHTPQALIKDISLTTGVVSGRFAAFNNKDADGDIFLKGAFTKSINENGPQSRLKRIAYLYQHQVHSPLGAISELEESDKGLDFVASIPDTTLGTDTLKMYAAGVLKEHSVGISIIHGNEEQGSFYITEAKLWEGSVVTWGSNEETPFTGFKSLTRDEAINEMNTFTKAIRNGTFTDSTFNLLEIGLEQIKAHINSLNEPNITLEPNADLIEHFNKKLNLI